MADYAKPLLCRGISITQVASPGPLDLEKLEKKTLSQQPDVEVVRGCDGKPHTKGKQEFHLISFASEALNSVKRFLARTLSNTKELQ
jgi:hypothetical protein